jgi:hypothetical protein
MRGKKSCLLSYTVPCSVATHCVVPITFAHMFGSPILLTPLAPLPRPPLRCTRLRRATHYALPTRSANPPAQW